MGLINYFYNRFYIFMRGRSTTTNKLFYLSKKNNYS